MTITNARATFGLNAKATPVKSGTSGTVQIGDSNESVSLTSATKAVSFDAVIVGTASDFIIDISDLDNTGSTAWTAGTAQVESALVSLSGAVTTGTMAITLTSSVVAGSPLAVNVPLVAATHTTAALVAQAVVDVLNATAAVALYYTATRSTATVVLTRKTTSTYTVNGTSITVKPADDATLKLEWSAALGISALVASTSTTPGVATAGTYCPDLDGTDFEGETTGGIASGYAMYIRNNALSSSSVMSSGLVDGDPWSFPILPNSRLEHAGPSPVTYGDITIAILASGDNSAQVTVTLVGA